MARILFFGRLRDVAGGAREVPLSDDLRTAGDVRAWLARNDADLGAALMQREVRIAVDQSFADAATPITDRSEIAFMPPLSGG